MPSHASPAGALSPTDENPHKRAGSRRRRIIGICVGAVALLGLGLFAAAWILGGRAVASSPTFQDIMSTETNQGTGGEAADGAFVDSEVAPEHGIGEDGVDAEVAAALPGFPAPGIVEEIPEDSVSTLKAMGWTIPYLSRAGFEHEHVETTTIDGVRMVQARLADGDDYINVSETRTEEPDAQQPSLAAGLGSAVNTDGVVIDTVELSTGQEASLFFSIDGAVWTSVLESSSAQYMITSDSPVEAAADISSRVMVADRSRVPVMPSTPEAGERLERGFEELFGFLNR